MKAYYGNYVGLVISGGNEDPEYRGRTQVFIPHIMPTIYEGWNQAGVDRQISITGNNLEGGLTQKEIEHLKKVLPWAECATPVVGSGPAGILDKTGNLVGELLNRGSGIVKGALAKLIGPEAPGVNPSGQPAANPNQDKSGKSVQYTTNGTKSDITTNALTNNTIVTTSNVSMDLNGSPNSVALEGGPLKRDIVRDGVTIKAGTAVGDHVTSFHFSGSKNDYANGVQDVFIAVPSQYVGHPFAISNNSTNPPKTIIAYGLDGGGVLKAGGNYAEISNGASVALGFNSFDIKPEGTAYTQGNYNISVAPITDGSMPIITPGTLSREEYNTLIGDPLTAEQKQQLAAQDTSDKASASNSATIVDNGNTIQHPSPHPSSFGPNTNYQPTGSFGYARAGQLVWVFFQEGNPLFPVYFAASYGASEWKNIYQSHSPAFGLTGAGNDGTNTENSFMSVHMDTGGGMRSGMSVANGTLDDEFIHEIFHKNGSNLKFSKSVVELNSMYDFKKTIMGDDHEAISCNKELKIEGDFNTVVYQDTFVTIGNWDTSAQKAAADLQKIIDESMKLKSSS
jgi:hypothetical protein